MGCRYDLSIWMTCAALLKTSMGNYRGHDALSTRFHHQERSQGASDVSLPLLLTTCIPQVTALPRLCTLWFRLQFEWLSLVERYSEHICRRGNRRFTRHETRYIQQRSIELSRIIEANRANKCRRCYRPGGHQRKTFNSIAGVNQP